jgi:Zn-dependent protease with chaperone function
LSSLLPIPLSVYFAFFHDYFSTNYVATGLGFGVGIFAVSYLFFRGSNNQRFKTSLLLLMLVDSTTLWIFVLSSLAFCVALVQQYWSAAEPTIALVSRFALFSSLGLSAILVGVFRRRSIERTYATIRNNSVILGPEVTDAGASYASRGKVIFQNLLNRASFTKRVTFALLTTNEVRLPSSLAFDSRKLKMVGIQRKVESILDDDEIESVLAHELGHIANRDSLQKTIATGYRIAFPFDPIARLIEAAVYRNREISADEYSTKLTSKPASLASALLKIYENVQLQIPKQLATIGPPSSQLSVLREKGGISESISSSWRLRVRKLLSKQPTLEDRIERLLSRA